MRIPLEDNEKKILINVEDDETRIAVVDNATLDNLYIEQTHRTQILGNILFPGPRNNSFQKTRKSYLSHHSSMSSHKLDF